MDLHTLASQTIARCRELAGCTETPGAITRTFLCPAMHEVHQQLRTWMEGAGLEVSMDAVGNLHGVTPNARPGVPRLLLGSHLDTVPNGGAFDGPLGVLLALAAAESLREETLPIALEMVGFSEEEGVRFARPFLGSLALIGELGESLLGLRDAEGVSVREAIANFGLDPRHIPEARLRPETMAYLEVHIEQGPVLEAAGLGIGVVDSIVGQTRLQMEFTGRANHAGTTPMHLRQDALSAAAAWIVAVETLARMRPGLVATVGRLEVAPGVGNVIAGSAAASLDVRHADDGVRTAAVEALLRAAASEAASRGVHVAHTMSTDQAAVSMSPHLVALLERAAHKAGHETRRLNSGAGHDAMVLARRVPAAMLFVRSPGGLSHHPDETVRVEDVQAALATIIAFIHLLAFEGVPGGRVTDTSRYA